MKRRYFFPLLVACFIFLYIGPVNLAPSYVPSAIVAEQNLLSDETSYYTERGLISYLGAGKYQYHAKLGMRNTWDGNAWVPYIVSGDSVSFAGSVLTVFNDYVTLDYEGQEIINDMRWEVQHNVNDKWRVLDLWEQTVLSPVETQEKVIVGNEMTDGFSFANVTYHISNCDMVKVRVDFIPYEAGEYRFIWSMSGIQGDIQEGNESIAFDEVQIGFNDLIESNMSYVYDWTVADKKLDVVIGPVVLEASEHFVIDPSVNPVLGADGNDDFWMWIEGEWTHVTTGTEVYTYWTEGTHWYIGQFRFQLAIPQGATIDSATFTGYETQDSTVRTGNISRIDETNVGVLEDDVSIPSYDWSNHKDYAWDASGVEWGDATDIADIVQTQVNLVDWESDFYIGLAHSINSTGTHRFEDYQAAGTNHAYMNVTYTVGAANNAPVNDQTPTLDNADDTDNMYAQYREYQLTVYVSDADGYADIDYLEVSLWDNGQSTEYFRFRYDEDTDTFTEEYDSGSVVSLNTGSSSATEAGNDIDATFYFTIDWDHADLTDIDTECFVTDDEPESDTDFYEANFDVETRLDYSVAPSVTGDDAGTIDRGDYDESFSIGGTLIYYGSTDDNPASNQIDVWVSASEYGSNVGPWSDTTLTAGAFVVTCYADNALGQDTYTIKPVLEGAGSGGSSQYYTSDLTDTYIADIVQVQSYTVSDSRVNINDNVNVDVTLWYDYDNSLVTDGTVTINGESAVHQGSGVWRITVSESTVTSNTYDTVAVTGNTHGLTTEDQNGQSTLVIWDRLVVTLSADSYAVVNGTQVNITISVVYDYDDAAFTYYNLSMTRDAVFWYVFNHANFSLCNDTAADVEYTYTVNALNNETTYGITAFTSNSIDIEWSSTPPTTTTPTVTTNTESIFFHLFLSLQMWGYLGPLGLITIGYIVTSKEKNLGFLFFIVESIVIVTYLNLAAVTPDYWWHAYIMLFGCMSTLMYSLWDRG